MKLFLSSIVSTTLYAVTPSLAFADTSLLNCADNPGLSTCKAANSLTISGTLATVIQFLFVIAVILALGFLVYGGIKWITSGGDKAGVEGARSMIIAAIIGLIVVFLAYIIVNLVLTFLTGKDLKSVTIPSLTGCTATETDPSTGKIKTCSPTDPNGGYSCTTDGNSCIRE